MMGDGMTPAVYLGSRRSGPGGDFLSAPCYFVSHWGSSEPDDGTVNTQPKARPWQLGKAFELLRLHLPAEVPVIFGRAAGRPDERMVVQALGQADASIADMATCVIIGSAETRIIARPGLPDLVYTPRFMAGGKR